MPDKIAPEEIKRLYTPFKPSEHEVREGSTRGRVLWFTYITRQAIIRRLDEVFPGEWTFEILEIRHADGYTNVTARLTIRGMPREYNGGNSGSFRDENEEKAAVTDAFKRVASMWGIGLYLADAPQIWTEGDYLSEKNGRQVVTDYAKRATRERDALAHVSKWLRSLGIASEKIVEFPGAVPQEPPPSPAPEPAPGTPEPPAPQEESPAPKPAPSANWPTTQALKDLFAAARANLIGDETVTNAEISGLVGIAVPFDMRPEAWGRYPSINAAKHALKEAWLKKSEVEKHDAAVPF